MNTPWPRQGRGRQAGKYRAGKDTPINCNYRAAFTVNFNKRTRSADVLHTTASHNGQADTSNKIKIKMK